MALEGAVAYQGSTAASIAAIGEIQSFTIDLAPGQSISLVVTPDAALEANIQVRDPFDAPVESVAADTLGQQIAISTLAATEAGTYIVDVSGLDDTVGEFTLALYLNASLEGEAFGGDANDNAAEAQILDIGTVTSAVERGLAVGALSAGVGEDDWYSFSLSDSQKATIVLEAIAASPVSVELYRGDGTTLVATGLSESGTRQAIHGFADTTTDSAADEYLLRVTGADAHYQLVVAVGADFNNLSNGLLESAQDITLFGRALGYVSLDGSAYYGVAVIAGDELAIATTTPSGEPVMPNGADVQIEIFDPSGAAIPHANALGNESFNHTALLSGFYTVRVFSESDEGDYLLSIDGATGTEDVLTVMSAAPASGALLSSSPSELVVTFNDALDAGTVSADDLLIDGPTPVSASGVTVDGTTVTFQLPALVDGTYTLSLAAGSVADLDGQSLAAAFSTGLTLDQTPPQLTSASLAQGAIVTSGSPLVLTFQFDEPLDESSLDASDVALVGVASGVHVPTAFSYADLTLTVSYAALAEDSYTLTLHGGDGALEDLAGNSLAGGNHVLAFSAEAVLAVVSADLASGALLATSPAQLLLTFNDALDAGTVSASDLSIDDGQSVLSASGVTVDGTTVTFQLPALVDGTYTLSLAAGSVADLDGQSLAAALSASFTVDQTPPQLTSASLAQGAVVPSGSPLVLTFQFDEPLDESSLDASDVALVGVASGVHVPTAFSYADLTLTVSYAALAEDSYTLTLTSGDDALEDLAGNSLAGGDYVLTFSAEQVAISPLDLPRVAPLGSLIFAGTTAGLINAASDVDRYSFAVQQGDSVAIVAIPDDPLAILTIQLEGISESIASHGPGRAVALPPTAVASTDTLVVRVKGDRPTPYTLKVVLNATVEELVTIAQAGGSLSLDPSRVDLGVGSRVAVLGHSDPKSLPVGTPSSETNDTIDTAIFSGIGIASGIDVYTGSGTIGDNPAFAPGLDVDMFEFQLDVGQSVTIEIDAEGIGSTLDSFLTLFDSSGEIVVVNDDGESSDSVVEFTAAARDTYYVGISGFANQNYDPFTAGRGFAGSVGTYEIRIQRGLGSGGSATSTSAVSLPDVDAFTFDLTGLIGKSVDLFLAGLGGADLSGASLQLLGPNGTSVLATAITNPVGLAPTNVDLAVLNFIVPTSGIYTARMTSQAVGDYVMLLTERMQFVIEPNDTLSGPLRLLTGENPTLGFLTGPPNAGPVPTAPPPATGSTTPNIIETESNNAIASANQVPLGFDSGEFAQVSVLGSLAGSDADYFRAIFNTGDILVSSLSGAGSRVTIYDDAGNELMGSSQNPSFVFPENSPLILDGHSLAVHVAAESGDYFVRTSGVAGDYTLNLFVLRPAFESQFIGAHQTIFLDFGGVDGVVLDRATFGGSGIATLSPLMDFLPAWGLSAGDLDALIDTIVSVFTENLSTDPRALGTNGDFDVSAVPGQFDVQILNSRDHANPFGQANVSRIIIGGTIGELGVSPVIGLAESIDIGNFDAEETAVVLLDLLSSPANSLNQFALDPSVSKTDFVGLALGNIAAHEAAHYLGAFHTNSSNGVANIIDQGGNLATFIGLVGGVWGDGNEIEVDFVTDVFAPNEDFTGSQNVLNIISFALASGMVDASLFGPVVLAVDPPSGVNWTAISDITIEFSEPLEPATANDPANYSLFDVGVNGVFEDGGGDDVLILVTPSYDGSTTVQLAIDDALAPLTVGRFHLIIGGAETSIEDLDGNPLNSVSGNGGTTTIHDFEVLAIESGGDVYSFSLAANKSVTFATATPNDDLPNARNSLNPILIVYDQNGNPLAVDRDSRDGRNALLVFKAPTTGNYRVRVLAESGTGEYVLEYVNAALQGDFNRDGSVDAADYVLWRKTLSASVLPSAGADGNGNGLIENEDLSVWRGNFGQTSVAEGSGTALTSAAGDAFTGVEEFTNVSTASLPVATSPFSTFADDSTPSGLGNDSSIASGARLLDASRAAAFASLRFNETRRIDSPRLLNKSIASPTSHDVDETLRHENLLLAIELLGDHELDRDRTVQLARRDSNRQGRSEESSNQAWPLDLAFAVSDYPW